MTTRPISLIAVLGVALLACALPIQAQDTEVTLKGTLNRVDGVFQLTGRGNQVFKITAVNHASLKRLERPLEIAPGKLEVELRGNLYVSLEGYREFVVSKVLSPRVLSRKLHLLPEGVSLDGKTVIPGYGALTDYLSTLRGLGAPVFGLAQVLRVDGRELLEVVALEVHPRPGAKWFWVRDQKKAGSVRIPTRSVRLTSPPVVKTLEGSEQKLLVLHSHSDARLVRYAHPRDLALVASLDAPQSEVRGLSKELKRLP